MPRGSLPELIHRLNHDYPYDVGVFCLFMLNVFQLAPGEALYMGANDPHAYISGDCVECMATSDNVVRAGLTPKLRDVPVLVDMLTYDFGPPETKITRGVKYVDARNIESETSKLYDPPIEEFSVLQTSLSPGHSESFYNTSGPTILIVTAGKGVLTVVDSDVDSNEQRDSGEDKSSSESQDLATGYVIFVKPGTSYRLEADNDHRLEVYAAWCTA
ncbi:Mannose-6-phosphate isomerase [Spiromyces aspiralis]|uniref:Mannose-6-phosphate isomerase n=1 Tax=Spiromyces aspiralis TaxID=68401 RepID=A0ACC1HMH8_9FUNG|nr:Mannose-6-phosphate isomerase [Spiromyces aspiralis]